MILTALNNYYYRLCERNPNGISSFGFSTEKISYALVLSPEGVLLDILDIRDASGEKPTAKLLSVPKDGDRSGSKAPPFFLWDNAKYVLGLISTSDLKKDSAAREEAQTKALDRHQVFKMLHQEALRQCQAPLIKAFLLFLGQWNPSGFSSLAFANDEIRDANLVLKLDGENTFLHQLPEALSAWEDLCDSTSENRQRCLITGRVSVVARTHPKIRGVWGAQPAGASIVSFNKDAFESYGKSQGDNSPISEQAAFAYTTVLNHLLQKDSRQCLHLGDTSMVFWAEADNHSKAQLAENTLAAFLDMGATDESETQKLQSALQIVAKGRPISDWDPDLAEDTKVYVLGLAPNASRLSIRYWEACTLQHFAERLAQHYTDLALSPLPWKVEPSVYRLLLQTVPHRNGKEPKADDIQPHLGGELMRAILTGGRYPHSLLANLIMRMRADGDITGLRVALCKAVLTRDRRLKNTNQKEIPMSLDRDNTDSGYLLGRLFSVLEEVQRAALGKGINSTIRDRYYGSASATPGGIFPVLVRNAQNHLSRLRKDKPGLAVKFEKEIAEIVGKIGSEFPKSLHIESQGHFAIGYYHQNSAHYNSNKTPTEEGEDA